MITDTSQQLILADRKSELRRIALARREVAAAQSEAAVSKVASLAAEVLDTLRGMNTAAVAGYIAIRGEFDAGPLLTALNSRGCTLSLPVIQPGPALIFRAWQPGMPLVKRRFGLLEPDDGQPIVFPDIVLVPLLGFDRWGNRLGYGAGYYDAGLKVLREAHRVVAVGVGYSEQEFGDIPAEPHDETLDYLLTPEGLFRCG